VSAAFCGVWRALATLPREKIPERARPFVDRWFAEQHLKPVTAGEVPMNLMQSLSEVDEETARKLLRLVDNLEDDDDVQEVFFNFEVPEALLEEEA